jgi:hypothetical protein
MRICIVDVTIAKTPIATTALLMSRQQKQELHAIPLFTHILISLLLSSLSDKVEIVNQYAETDEKFSTAMVNDRLKF